VLSLSAGTEGEGEWLEQRRRRRIGGEVRATVQVEEKEQGLVEREYQVFMIIIIYGIAL
jgi:hypothetical protein